MNNRVALKRAQQAYDAMLPPDYWDDCDDEEEGSADEDSSHL